MALTEVSDEDIERVLQTDLIGPYALVRAIWPTMAEQRWGRIVNVSSGVMLGIGKCVPYAVAKAGLLGLTFEAAAWASSRTP